MTFFNAIKYNVAKHLIYCSVIIIKLYLLMICYYLFQRMIRSEHNYNIEEYLLAPHIVLYRNI